jgi:predicted nucleic acid-binding protein
MIVLFDTDVILDLLLDREPFAEAAREIFCLSCH